MIRRQLYPPITPYFSDMLPVSDGHVLYYELSGNPEGKPVIFLHGGPGGATSADHRRFFDPDYYKIIVFDQRGCGKSMPYASLENNTTWHLVKDIETIRETLNIHKWQVFGGSWGSTLALAYAQTHPERVTELVLRGIYTLKQDETNWLMQEGGASAIFPDEWHAFISHLTKEEQAKPLESYYKRLTSNDETVRQQAALAFAQWEMSLVHLLPTKSLSSNRQETKYAEAISRIEAHYFIHNGFLNHDNQLLDGAKQLSHIPTHIVHGRYDVVCPVRNAWRLFENMPHATLTIVPDAGHAAFEPGIIDGLVKATDNFKAL